MENGQAKSSNIKYLVAQIGVFVSDEEILGRLYTDLLDAREACEWFIENINIDGNKQMKRNELEDWLIDLDVNMLTHLVYHLKSIKKVLPTVLEAVAEPEDEGG